MDNGADHRADESALNAIARAIAVNNVASFYANRDEYRDRARMSIAMVAAWIGDEPAETDFGIIEQRDTVASAMAEIAHTIQDHEDRISQVRDQIASLQAQAISASRALLGEDVQND